MTSTASPLRRLGLSSLTVALLALAPALARPADATDGYRFDPGALRSTPADGAPEATAGLAPLVGRWAVTLEESAGEETSRRSCSAQISYVNRGHGFFERLHCPRGDDEGARSFDSIVLVAFDSGRDLWARGEADSSSESIRITTGAFDGDRLVLHDAGRPGGAGAVTFWRDTVSPVAQGAFTVTRERSLDQAGWQPVWRRSYRRSEEDRPPETSPTDFGTPDPDRPAAAAAFDFLIGHRQASHTMTLPDGNTVQWPSTTTAIHTLGGRAILEFDWFDLDPRLPDAATTIVRIYNRAMRRWESLYLSNRGNGMLHFGGRQEGDEIVLTNFGTDTSVAPISHYVFHGIEDDRYDWYAESSSDRGATFQKTWIIEVRLFPPADPPVDPEG